MTTLEAETKRYWSYASLAWRLNERWGRVDAYIVKALENIGEKRASERLSCAVGGVLASLMKEG